MERWFGFMFVCALGVVLGCSGSTGNGETGGSGGQAGTAGGGGMAGSGGMGATYSIGGTVTGLVGGTLGLQNNGNDDLSIGNDGPFTFATPLTDGSNYLVTVLSQPSSPKQFCRVADGSGTLAGADVTNVAVSCDNGPMVSGFARFRDENRSGTADPGDVLIVPFDVDVRVNGAGPSDFSLPVSGDSLGAGATVSAGPTSFDVTITSGTGARLRTSGTFDPADVGPGDPSGIDVSATLGADAIEGIDGRDAIPSIPIDLFPEFVNTNQSLDPDDFTTDIALGDVDGDDDLDLVIVNSFNPNRVYTNNGSGTYTDSGQELGDTPVGPNGTQSVALGDVDGDEDLDMVTGNAPSQGTSTNRIYLNDGAGAFGDSGQALGGEGEFTYAVALGDIDKDGDLDLVVGNLATPNQVFINDGAGVFTDSGQALGGANATQALALGDIDGDGDLDLIEGNGGAVGEHPNHVYVNDGTGTFTDNGQSLGVSITLDVALGDIDGDGDLDLATGNASALGNRIYTNDGTGIFTDSSQNLTGNINTWSIDLRDVDDDGDLDFISGNNSDTTVWVNDGAGTFAHSGQILTNVNTHAIALGDVDADGDLDLAVGNGFTGEGSVGSRIYTGSLTDQ